MGARSAIEALHSLAGRFARPRRMDCTGPSGRSCRSRPTGARSSTTGRSRSPRRCAACASRSSRCRPGEVRAVREEWEAKLAEAVAAGRQRWRSADRLVAPRLGPKTEQALLDGTAATFREGRIHAVRIGDGVIVSGPGEVFSEIGMAVKERSPGRPTMYAGFTNGLSPTSPPPPSTPTAATRRTTAAAATATRPMSPRSASRSSSRTACAPPRSSSPTPAVGRRARVDGERRAPGAAAPDPLVHPRPSSGGLEAPDQLEASPRPPAAPSPGAG